MLRTLMAHWTAVLIVLVVVLWGVFYLPTTPSYAVLQLKMAIDARDGQRAVQFVDFQSVVRQAAAEMVEKQVNPDDTLGAILGRGAAQLLSGPAAEIARNWAQQQVDQGARNVQMPAAAVVGAVLLLHRSGATAQTHFRDPKGQTWDIRMARNGEGRWQVVEINNIQQLLGRFEAGHAGAMATP